MADNTLVTKMSNLYGVNIVGLDEVGRGSWAGPTAVGAVILPPMADISADSDAHKIFSQLNDSKKLSAKKREMLAVGIKNYAIAWSVGMSSAEEVDTLGLSDALTLSTVRALDQIMVSIDGIILDGVVNYLQNSRYSSLPVQLGERLDSACDAVAAASIVAKTTRDNYMLELAKIYPGYGWENNKGYFAPAHNKGLTELGACVEHRTSWAWVSKYPNIVKNVR